MAVTGKSGKIYADTVKDKSVSELFRMGYTSREVDDFKHVTLSRKSSGSISIAEFERFSKMGGLLLVIIIIAALGPIRSLFDIFIFSSGSITSTNVFETILLRASGMLSITLCIIGITLICLRVRVGRVLFIASYSAKILICIYNIAISGYIGIYDIPTILLFIAFILYMALANRVKVYLKVNKSKPVEA